MTELSIIIVNWNTAQLLKQCLESIIGDRGWVLGDGENDKTTITQPLTPNTEIIVVDNGSMDGSVEMIGELIRKYSRSFLPENGCAVRRWQAGVSGPKILPKEEKASGPLIRINSCELTIKLIENRTNLGFAKGNNIGIREARGEYIMLLNSDTIVKEGAIEKLREFLDSHSEIDIVGPKLLNQDGSPQANCGRFPTLPVVFTMLFKEHFGGSKMVRWSPEKSQTVDWLMGAAFVSRKNVFEKIGGLDENIFMYMEEVEWFYRAKKAGFKTFFVNDAKIVHLGHGSSKSGKTEPILNIYKGIIYFYKKHQSPLRLLILRLMLKLKAIIALIIGYLKNDNYLKKTYGQALKIS